MIRLQGVSVNFVVSSLDRYRGSARVEFTRNETGRGLDYLGALDLDFESARDLARQLTAVIEAL